MILEGDLSHAQILEKVGGYQSFLPDDAVIEHEGKAVKLRDVPDIQNAKDLPTLAKNYVESQRELGRRVRIPGKDAKPEEMQAFKAKLTEAGVLPAPLASPQDYGIVKPDDLPKGIAWSDEMATEFATVLHKHGAPKELAGEILALYNKALFGAQQGLQTSLEQGMTALKTEFGDKFDERMEFAKRLTPTLFTSEEELAFADRTGLANHPLYLGPIMRLAPLAQQDSSFMAGLQRAPGGAMSKEEAVAEHTKVMSDPSHPMYAAYAKGDSKALEYVDSLYKRVFAQAAV